MTDYSPFIRKMVSLILLAFAAMFVVLGYWQVAMSDRMNSDRYNQRAALRLRHIEPGRIMTSDKTVILGHKATQDGWECTYPQGKDFAHLTGYGPRSGLQKGLVDALYGQKLYSSPWSDLLRGGPAGNDVILTINARAQRVAMQELEGKKGAVVALDPQTGATLVIASAPTYDPTEVLRSPGEFDLFRYDPASPELNRAVQGLYPPGSVFKIFTAAAGLDLGLVTPKTEFSCAGVERVNGANIVCRITSGHGRLDLDRAFWDSCNVAFAKLGAKIGITNFAAYVKKFHLLDPANIAMPSSAGRIYDFRGFKGKVALAEAAFGQGATMMSPFQIARLTAAIANGGHVLQPFIVAQVQTPEGQILKRGQAEDFGQAIKPETAREVAGMMVDVVEKGTGRVAALSTVSVAAKTGTAQVTKSGPTQAWFTCYAPADKPSVVVAVVVEGGEAGGAVAGPIARRVMTELLDARKR